MSRMSGSDAISCGPGRDSLGSAVAYLYDAISRWKACGSSCSGSALITSDRSRESGFAATRTRTTVVRPLPPRSSGSSSTTADPARCDSRASAARTTLMMRLSVSTVMLSTNLPNRSDERHRSCPNCNMVFGGKDPFLRKPVGAQGRSRPSNRRPAQLRDDAQERAATSPPASGPSGPRGLTSTDTSMRLFLDSV